MMPRYPVLLVVLAPFLAGCGGPEGEAQAEAFVINGRLGRFDWVEASLTLTSSGLATGPDGSLQATQILEIDDTRYFITDSTAEPVGFGSEDAFVDHPAPGLASLSAFVPFLALRHDGADWQGTDLFLGLTLETVVDDGVLTARVPVSDQTNTFEDAYTMVLAGPNTFPREVFHGDTTSATPIWRSTGRFEWPGPIPGHGTVFHPVEDLEFAPSAVVPPSVGPMPFSPASAIEILRSQSADAQQFFSRNPDARLTDGFYTEGLLVPALQDGLQRWDLVLQAPTERLTASVRHVGTPISAMPGAPAIGFVDMVAREAISGAVPVYRADDFVVTADSIYRQCERLAGPSAVTLKFLDFGGTAALRAGDAPFAGLVRWGCGDAGIGAPIWDGVAGTLIRSRLDQ